MLGKKVICLNIPLDELWIYPKISIGKHYTVTNKLQLISDDGQRVDWINSNFFMDLSEYRNQKLEELGL